MVLSMICRMLCCVATASACLAADAPQCTPMAALPAGQIVATDFRVFKGKWILSTGDGLVFSSSDSGATWHQILGSTPPQVPPLPHGGYLVGPFDDKLFAIPTGGSERYLLSTTDGTNWIRTPTPVVPATVAAVRDTWVISASGVGVYDVRISRDAGRTWINAPPPNPGQFNEPRLVRTRNRILLFDGRTPQSGLSFMRVRRLSPNSERWEDVTPCECSLFWTGWYIEGLAQDIFGGWRRQTYR